MDIARAVSRNSEENEYGFLGLDQLIMDGIEEKLQSVLEAGRDGANRRRAYDRIGQEKVGRYQIQLKI